MRFQHERPTVSKPSETKTSSVLDDRQNTMPFQSLDLQVVDAEVVFASEAASLNRVRVLKLTAILVALFALIMTAVYVLLFSKNNDLSQHQALAPVTQVLRPTPRESQPHATAVKAEVSRRVMPTAGRRPQTSQASQAEQGVQAKAVQRQDTQSISRDLKEAKVREILKNVSGLEPSQQSETARETRVETQATEPVPAMMAALRVAATQPAPTEAPTSLSTAAPTAAPTAEPTQAPTQPAETEQADDLKGFEATNQTLYVDAEVVNVREQPSTNAELLRQVHQGDAVLELKRSGQWSLVCLPDGTTGFIFSNLLASQKPAQDTTAALPAIPDQDFKVETKTLYSHFSGVRIRESATTASSILGVLLFGSEVHVTGETNGWYKIQMDDGRVGYVFGDYLKEIPVPKEELTGQAQGGTGTEMVQPNYDTSVENTVGGQKIANLARMFVGKPYALGATGPDAFDCSGLVQYLYKQVGVTVGRTTYDQVYDGIPVSFSYMNYSNLRPGDILLFGEGNDIFHSAIYIGNNQMIHASVPGVGVIVDNLTLDFYANRLAHVRRIFN